MGKKIITQVQETQRVPIRVNPRQNIPRHILIKLTKIKHKEQILKATSEKKQKHTKTHINQINEDQTQRRDIKSIKGKTANNTQGIPIMITADLSLEALQARREWEVILKVMKEKNLQPRLLYPAIISFKYEGEIKSFTDKQKLREFNTTKSALQKC